MSLLRISIQDLCFFSFKLAENHWILTQVSHCTNEFSTSTVSSSTVAGLYKPVETLAGSAEVEVTAKAKFLSHGIIPG